MNMAYVVNLFLKFPTIQRIFILYRNTSHGGCGGLLHRQNMKPDFRYNCAVQEQTIRHIVDVSAVVVNECKFSTNEDSNLTFIFFPCNYCQSSHLCRYDMLLTTRSYFEIPLQTAVAVKEYSTHKICKIYFLAKRIFP